MKNTQEEILIKPKVLKQLDVLNSKLDDSCEKTLAWIEELEKAEIQLRSISDFKEYNEMLKKISKAEAGLNKEAKRRFDIEMRLQVLYTRIDEAKHGQMVSTQSKIDDATNKLAALKRKQLNVTIEETMSSIHAHNKRLERLENQHKIRQWEQ